MPDNYIDILTQPALVVLLAYLLGSLSFAVIVSKFMGLSDPRSYGSKNPGATNVLRSGNKKAAILTLLFDAVKGWVPVVWILNHGAPFGLTEGAAAAAGLAAFLGHLYPIFFRFQGGKGVATALGVLMGVSPLLGIAVALTWLGVAWFFRYSVIGSFAGGPVSACLLRVVGRRALVVFQRGSVWHVVCDGHSFGLAAPGQCESFDCWHRIQIGRQEKLTCSCPNGQIKKSASGAFFNL
jgi:acyl-phosphate glycerol 3-phosphate acyltransferase